MPAHALYERHRPLLDDALQALSRRVHWSPFPEAPKVSIPIEASTQRDQPNVDPASTEILGTAAGKTSSR